MFIFTPLQQLIYSFSKVVQNRLFAVNISIEYSNDISATNFSRVVVFIPASSAVRL